MSNTLESTIRIGVYGLTGTERAELAQVLQVDGLHVEVVPFEQRGAERIEAVRFVVEEIILPGIIGNAVWDAFKSMLKKAWQFVHRKNPEAKISGWVVSIQNNYSLNVMLPDREQDLDSMLNLLPDFLQELETEREALKNKMISVAFDADNQKLLVQKMQSQQILV